MQARHPDAPRSGSNQAPHLVQSPAISMPTGGGAIRGIGEKFGTNPVTGTATLSVPIHVSPGRAKFGPQLSIRRRLGPCVAVSAMNIGRPRVRHAIVDDVMATADRRVKPVELSPRSERQPCADEDELGIDAAQDPKALQPAHGAGDGRRRPTRWVQAALGS